MHVRISIKFNIMIEGLFEEIKNEIEQLYLEYKDSENISLEVKNNALKFAKLLSIKVLSNIDDIYPNPNGTFSFSFDDSEVEIGQKTMSYFIEKNPIVYANKKEINLTEVNIFNDYIVEKMKRKI